MAPDPAVVIAELNAQRAAFKNFLSARVGEADAEDILQQGLARALNRAGEIRDPARLVPWFYQLLRNAVVDHYRSVGASRRRNAAAATLIAALENDVEVAAAFATRICTCLGAVVATLTPQHANLVQRVDLNGESVQDAARALGISANNASVTLHRARKELRVKLEAFCGPCAGDACLECDCGE